MADEDIISDPARIAAILRDVHQHVRVLDVQLEPDSPVYTSSVIRLDPDAQRLFLDELNPQLGHWEIVDDHHQELHIRASLRGASIQFSAPLKEVLFEDGIALYACAYPDELSYLQRRETFRVYLPADEHRAIRLQHAGSGDNVLGWVRDLSAQGFCVELGRDEIGAYAPGARFFYSCLVLPGINTPLSGEAVLVNTRIAVNPARLAAGFRIINLDPTAERILMRVAMQYQREARRTTPPE